MEKIKREKVFGPARLTIRELFLPKAGDSHRGHRHKIDHVTALVKGSVMVTIGDRPAYRADAPAKIFIDKDVMHRFEALSDGVEYWCIFATNDADLTMHRFCPIGDCSACTGGPPPVK